MSSGGDDRSGSSRQGHPAATVARREVEIVNQRGLHARAAAKFAKLADELDGEILVTGNGMTVSGLSIMGLMLLAAGPGTRIEIAVAGAAAEQSVASLAALVDAGFDEDQAPPR